MFLLDALLLWFVCLCFLFYYFVCDFCVAPTFTIVDWIFRFPFESFLLIWISMNHFLRFFWDYQCCLRRVLLFVHPHPLWTASKYGYCLSVWFLIVCVLYYFIYRFRSNGFSVRGGRHVCIGVWAFKYNLVLLRGLWLIGCEKRVRLHACPEFGIILFTFRRPMPLPTVFD